MCRVEEEGSELIGSMVANRRKMFNWSNSYIIVCWFVANVFFIVHYLARIM